MGQTSERDGPLDGAAQGGGAFPSPAKTSPLRGSSNGEAEAGMPPRAHEECGEQQRWTRLPADDRAQSAEYPERPKLPHLRVVARNEVLIATDVHCLRTMAAMLGVPYLRLPRPLPEASSRLLPYDLAFALRAIPVGGSAKAVTVAFDAGWTERQVRRLRLAMGQPIFPVLTSRVEIDWALANWPQKCRCEG